MLGFLDGLTARQRQLLAGLLSVVVLLAMAVGVVALAGSDDGGDDEAVQTEAPATSTSEGTTSVPPDGTTSTTASGLDAGEEPEGATAAAGGGRGSASTTSSARRSTGTSAPRSTTAGPGGGGGGATTTSTTRATTTTAAPTAGGCTTGGSGGAAAEIASRYCAHRSANGATARMERSSRLDAAAAAWAQELATRNELAHGPYATAVREVCPTCGPGENVAYWDVPNVPGTWSGWLASPPHRANLDRAAGGYYGTGSAAVAPGGRTFYVHIFAWLP